MAEKEPSRRRLLAVLGLASAGSVSGCLDSLPFIGETSGGTPTPKPEPSTAQSGTATSTPGAQSENFLAEEFQRSDQFGDVSAIPEQSFSFASEKETIEVKTTKSPIAALTALPARSQQGDRLKIRPGTIPPEELVNILRSSWGIEKITADLIVSVDGIETTLRGGRGVSIAALLGVADTQPRSIIVSRGDSLETAKSLADAW